MSDQSLTRRAMLTSAGLAVASVAARAAPAASTAQASRPQRFAGKVALVTGATSGMGAVTARELALAGAHVVFCGRRVDEGRAVESAIREAGGDALFVQTDVTDEPQVKALLTRVGERHGRLDFAFNNVGTSDGSGPLHELSTDFFDLIMATNLRGNFLQLKYEIPLLLAAGGGSIVGNSSIAGLRYLPAKAHYTAAKHGMIGMYCACALQYAKQNLRINVVCPGLIKTEKAMRVLAGDEHRLDARIPLGHIGESLDVATAVQWLFSEEARYITGAVIPIDGGQSVA